MRSLRVVCGPVSKNFWYTAIFPDHFSVNRQFLRAIFLCLAFFTCAVGLNADPASTPAPNTPASVDAYGASAIAASGFSGTRLQGKGIAPGVDPISKTVPDPDGVTLRVYGVDTVGRPMAGQLLNPSVALEFKAKDLGHVFGLAFDNAPSTETSTPGLYAAATSAFGLTIAGSDKDGDGLPDRLKKGAPGAKFVEGQFGPGPEAGPGSIWKIDRATGAVSLFTNLAIGGLKNSGTGIGGLGIDPASRTLYASDLDTGLIHRLSIAGKGRDLGQFDHGVSGRPARGKPAFKDDGERMDITSPEFDPGKAATWHFTPVERRVDGLAVHGGRLYYAVAEGPQIWSVGLEADGAFKADARFETGVESEKAYPVTSIAFDRDGRLIVAQRGTLESPNDFSRFVESGPAQVLRYKVEAPDDPATPALWKAEPEEYVVGNAKDHRASSGGLALENAYKPDGSIDAASCGRTIVVSADALVSVEALLPAVALLLVVAQPLRRNPKSNIDMVEDLTR